MSSSESKYRDEGRYEEKNHRKSQNYKDKHIDSSQHKDKKKREDYNKDERIRHEDHYSRSDLKKREKRERKYIDKSMLPESDDNNEQRRKSKKLKHDKNERLDRENDYCMTNFDKYKKVHSEKDDEMKRENKIRSLVQKIMNEPRNNNSNAEYSESSDSIYPDDLRTDTTKNKSKAYEPEKAKKRKHKKHPYRLSSDSSSSDTIDALVIHDSLKSDSIRSSVHKVRNKHRIDKRNKEEQDNIDDNDYHCDLRSDPSNYKFHSHSVKKDGGRSPDKFSDECTYKRKRESQIKLKRSHDKMVRSTERQRYKRQDEIIPESKESFESRSQAGSSDLVTDSTEPLSKRQKIVNINMRTGGAYIPPARLRMMQESIKDKGSEEYQRIAWEALKKSIVGMTNKVNSSNITEIVPELLKENIIRGRGVLARSIMQAQAASPTFTRVYAALVAIINTKFPEIGELILNRLIIQYKRGFRRNDKTICMTAARFLAQLLNQEVAHEVLILEIVTHLLENPTEDSVEIAIATLKECGKKLTLLTPKGMRAITQRVRDVLHEASIDMRVRYMIEVFFAVQKDGFKDFEVIPPELDLVEEDDKYTHLINLNEAVDAQDMLNVFKFDPDYLENEEKYKSVVNEILGDSSDESGNESDDESEEEEEKEENADGSDQKILDMTETNLVCLRRKIYLTIQSSLDFEECAHKLLKLELKPGQILEMCYMILDCCAQQRTYEKFYGLLAQRFCQLNKIYVEPFTEIFDNSYKTIHRLETNKLRNVAKFFAHLLYTDAISWNVLSIIKLNEDDTTSSSRIFIKILFQELCEYMGLPKLNERVKDVTLQEAFAGLFPRDHPHNTRFAINFFTSIGLGGLTDELREHLKSLPKIPAPLVPPSPVLPQSFSSYSSSSTETSESSESSSTSTSSDSDSSDEQNSSKKKTSRKHKK